MFLSEGLNPPCHWFISSVQIQCWPAADEDGPNVSIELSHWRQKPLPPVRLNNPGLQLCGCNPVSFAVSHIFFWHKAGEGHNLHFKSAASASFAPVFVCVCNCSGSLTQYANEWGMQSVWVSNWLCTLYPIFSLQSKEVRNIDSSRMKPGQSFGVES